MAKLTPAVEQPQAEQQGWRPYTATQAQALPTIPAGHPWLYAHYPSRWYVDVEAGEILPDFVQVSGQSGVGGTGREVPGGGGDMSGSILQMGNRGAKVFTDTMVPGFGCYIRPVPTRGGVVYLDACCDAIPGTAQLRIDAKRRLDMLRKMREQLDPPGVHVIEAQIERATRDHAAAYADADRNPIAKRAAERYAREIEIWQAALEPAADPIPTTTRGRKAAAED
jgi:hypothetical protein